VAYESQIIIQLVTTISLTWSDAYTPDFRTGVVLQLTASP